MTKKRYQTVSDKLEERVILWGRFLCGGTFELTHI